MGKVLYSAHYQLDMTLILLIGMIVLMLFIPKLQELSFAKAGKELTLRQKRRTRGLRIAGVIWATFIFSLYLSYNIDIYGKTVGAYQAGTYDIVEGYIEAFHPMPEEGHSSESFEVDGVYFEYTENQFPSAYSRTKPFGGVIRGDGQYVKLGFVADPEYGNVIVYIEEIAMLTK